MKQAKQDKLEIEFIDEEGLSATLEAIADICLLKAEHVRLNWQDHGLGLARVWESIRIKIDTCRATLQNDADIIQGRR